MIENSTLKNIIKHFYSIQNSVTMNDIYWHIFCEQGKSKIW